MPKYPHGPDKTNPLGYHKKKIASPARQPKNFLGVGATSEDSGVAPKEHHGMGFNYGMASKNPMGRMRGDSVGYIPVSKKKLGSAPTQVV